MTGKKIKKSVILLIIGFTLFSNYTNAQDQITLIWTVSDTVKKVSIKATESETFTVNWGDGTTETETGAGNTIVTLSHTYVAEGEYTAVITASNDCRFTYLNCGTYHIGFQPVKSRVSKLILTDCSNLENLQCSNCELTSLDLKSCTALQNLTCVFNKITNLDLSNCPALETVMCHDNKLAELNLEGCSALQSLYCGGYGSLSDLDLSDCAALRSLDCAASGITSLDITGCPALERISCGRNQLQLSDLFAVSKFITNNYNKYLGQQNLPRQNAAIGTEIFPEQSIFDGTTTNYTIETTGGGAVSPSNYTITNGKLKFNTDGLYVVTMTNNAIASHPDNPAKVTFQVSVSGNTGIAETTLSNITIYPNPTHDILFVEGDNFDTIKLYDMLGKVVLDQFVNGKAEININHLSNGIYSISIFSKGKIIENSKIVKQ
jgi:hypothetical protein